MTHLEPITKLFGTFGQFAIDSIRRGKRPPKDDDEEAGAGDEAGK